MHRRFEIHKIVTKIAIFSSFVDVDEKYPVLLLMSAIIVINLQPVVPT